jgi:chromosome condensin MukBEF ATPase and DNA-binding subunit MukB
MFTKRQGIALLMAVGFGGAAHAGSISGNKPEAATQTLAHIESVARTASEHAQQYRMMVAQSTAPVTAKVQLDGLQTAMNTMGKEVASLQANRSSLSQWQQAALDHIRPLLVEAAARTNGTIAQYNNRAHLWTPENRGRVQQVAQDTQQIASTLADYMQFQALREREARIAESHPEVSGASQTDVTPVSQSEGTVGR